MWNSGMNFPLRPFMVFGDGNLDEQREREGGRDGRESNQWSDSPATADTLDGKH